MIPALVGAAFAGAVAVSPGAPADAAWAPRRVAVLVGVDQYADPALHGLRYAAKDARDLAAVLGRPDVGGFDRVFVVEGAASTSRAALRDTLRVATADLQRDDTFLLYLSGHGTLTLDAEAGSRLWFLPSDGRLAEPETSGIAVAELEALVHGLPARRRVLVLDTCHNGRSGSKSSITTRTAQLVQGFRGEPPAPRDLLDVSESEARLYAAQYYQPAMEDPELQNGVYTHFLVQGLTAARGESDLDGDGLVDVAEAHAYASHRTITWSGGLQVPRAEYRIGGREKIFLAGREEARNAAEAALVYAWDIVLQRARLLVDGVPRGELPGLYALDPGSYVVEVQAPDGRTLARERVRLRAGDRLAVDDLVARDGPSLAVLGGASWLGGTDAFHALSPSVQVAWIEPFPVRGPWRPDAHLTVDAATGTLPSDGLDQTTGAVSAGLTWAAAFGPAWTGPTLDARVPFRSRDGRSQGQLTGAGGWTLGLDVPLGRGLRLHARTDALVSAQPFDGAWAPVYGLAVRAGFGTAR